jgi:hypothetical protein
MRDFSMKMALLFAFLFTSLFTETSSFAGTTQLTFPAHFKLKRHKTSSIHLPNFQQLSRYSPKKRAAYLKEFQVVLLKMDNRSSNSASVIDKVWAEFICSAFADETDVDYCVNRGVVLALDPTDQNCSSQGDNMHKFDTDKVLASYKMGDAITCSPGKQPCSPFFGFTAQGSVNCVSGNSTPACNSASNANGEIPLATVIQECAISKKSTSVPKINCDGLKNFFNKETAVVATKCANSTLTCANLIDPQIKGTTSAAQAGLSKDDTNAVLSFISAAQDVTQGPPVPVPPPCNPDKKRTRDRAATTTTPAALTVNAPVAPAAATTASTQNAAPANPAGAAATQAPTAAVQCTLPANGPQTIATLESLKSGSSSCTAITLPNHSLFKWVSDGQDPQSSAIIQLPNTGTAPPSSITVSSNDLHAMSLAAQALTGALGVDAQQLFNSYLPVSQIAQSTTPINIKSSSGTITSSSLTSSDQLALGSGTWKASDGTAIRYAMGIDPASQDPAIYLGVQAPGSTEATFGIRMQPDPTDTDAWDPVIMAQSQSPTTEGGPATTESK